MKLSSKDKEESVFGAADGLSSALGVVIAMAITNSSALVTAAVALAVGAAVSMGLSEWLSDSTKSIGVAFVMGFATLLGAISPAIPFLVFSGATAFALCGIISVIICLVIARLRPEKWGRSIIVTFGVTVSATSLAVGTSLIAGSV